MPPTPHIVSGIAYKGPYQGYGLISTTVSSGGAQTQNISVSDGVEVAASQTITLTHTSSEEELTATTNASGQFSFDLANLTSYSEGDALTLSMDTRANGNDDPNDTSKIMLRDERGKVHDDDYPIPINQVDKISAEPTGNYSTDWTVTRADLQPDSETITYPDGTSYKRTFGYNSSNVMTSRSRWVKQ